MSVLDSDPGTGTLSRTVNRARELSKRFTHWLFLAPSLIVYLVFLVLPMLGIFYISLFRWSGYGPATFIGLSNYFEVLTSDLFYKSSLNVTLYVITQLTIVTGGGLLVALAVRATYPRLRPFFRTSLFLPMVVMSVAVSLIWSFIYNPVYGVINGGIIPALGLDWSPIWLADPSLALWAIVIAASWQWFGFNMTIWLVGLQNIDQRYYEAARAGGIGAYRRFRHITLPLLKPTAIFLVTFTIIGSLRTFSYFWIMTQGGPGHATEVIVTWVYKTAFNERLFGRASAISTILFVLTMVVSLVNLKIMGLSDGGD